MSKHYGYYCEATNDLVEITGTFTGGELIQPISYIESTGTQYIDTGLIFKTPSDELDLDFEYVSFGSNYGRVFGTTNKYTGMRLSASEGGGYFYTEIGSKPVTTAGLTAALDTRYKVKFNKNGKLIINDVDYGAYAEQIYETLDSIYLFGYHGSNIYSSLKVYGSKFIRSGEIIRDYIPVRIGTTVELLDLVSWSFATRTGTFTAGADIPYDLITPQLIKVNSGDLLYGVGKNLFNKDETAISSIQELLAITHPIASRANVFGTQTIGEEVTFGTTNIKGIAIPCKKGDTFSWKPFGVCETSRLCFMEVDTEGKVLMNRETYLVSGYTHTAANDNCGYLLVEWSIDPVDNAKIMVVEEATIPTTYEPYHFGLHTDGSHKLMVGTQGVLDMGAQTWYSQSGGFKINLQGHANAGGIFTKQYPTAGYFQTWESAYNQGDKKISVVTGTGVNSVFIRDDSYSTPTELKAALAGKYLFYQRTDDTSFIPPVVVDITEILPSATSYFDKQTGTLYKDWNAIYYDGTQTIPGNYISQTGDLTPNQIVVYELSASTTETKTTTPVALTTKGNKTMVVDAEIPCYAKVEYLSKEFIPFINSKVEHDLDLVGSVNVTKTNNILEVM